MRTVVGKRGQATIVAVKLSQRDSVKEVYGYLRQLINTNTDKIMNDLRGKEMLLS